MVERFKETVGPGGAIALEIAPAALPLIVTVADNRCGQYVIERALNGGLVMRKLVAAAVKKVRR